MAAAGLGKCSLFFARHFHQPDQIDHRSACIFDHCRRNRWRGALRKVGRMGIKALIYSNLSRPQRSYRLAVVNFIKPGLGVTLAAANTDVLRRLSKSSEVIRRNDRACLSLQCDRIDGARRCFADCRIQRALCSCRLSRWRKRETNHQGDGEPVANHVQVHELRDDVCPDWSRRTMRTIGTQGPGVLMNLGKLIGSLYLALVIFVASIFDCHLDRADTVAANSSGSGEPAALAFATTSSESALPKSNGIDGKRFGARHVDRLHDSMLLATPIRCSLWQRPALPAHALP